MNQQIFLAAIVFSLIINIIGLPLFENEYDLFGDDAATKPSPRRYKLLRIIPLELEGKKLGEAVPAFAFNNNHRIVEDYFPRMTIKSLTPIYN